MNNNDAECLRLYKEIIAAGLDPEVEAGRKPPTNDFHSSVGLWQQLPPATWKKE